MGSGKVLERHADIGSTSYGKRESSWRNDLQCGIHFFCLPSKESEGLVKGARVMPHPIAFRVLFFQKRRLNENYAK